MKAVTVETILSHGRFVSVVRANGVEVGRYQNAVTAGLVADRLR